MQVQLLYHLRLLLLILNFLNSIENVAVHFLILHYCRSLRIVPGQKQSVLRDIPITTTLRPEVKNRAFLLSGCVSLRTKQIADILFNNRVQLGEARRISVQ